MEAADILPIDCWQSIFKHLDDEELEAVSLVCKDFYTISNISRDSLLVIQPRVGLLSRQLKRFNQLKNIYLIMLRGDLDSVILEIARSLISLDAFHIRDSGKFKIESLEELGSNPNMKNLKVLKFWLKGLHDDDLVVIANSFPNLEQLDLENLNYLTNDNSFTDFGVEILASKLKLLKKIRLIGYFPSDRSVVALASNCVFLQDVTMTCNRNHGMTENGIGFLLRNRPTLVALSIGGIKMDSSESTITIQNSISHAKALTSLEFSRMDVSDMLLNTIAKAKLRLKKFELNFCRNFTVAGLLMVLSNYQLTKFSVVGSNLVDVGMELILNKDEGKVTHINIDKCQVTNSTLFLLSIKCPSLVEIRMNKTSLDGQVNNGHNNIPLSKNHRVQNIYLTHCIISDESAKQFGLIFPNLKVLELSYCYQITSTGIEAILKSCKFIRKLILGGTIEADISELPEMNLEELILSNSSIDDEGLAVITKKCPMLVSLALSYCLNVTTEGIKQIVKNITTLKCLYMLGGKLINRDDLLEWMLSTGNLASLEKIYVGINYDFSEEQRDQFLHHGCLLTKSYRDFEEYP